MAMRRSFRVLSQRLLYNVQQSSSSEFSIFQKTKEQSLQSNNALQSNIALQQPIPTSLHSKLSLNMMSTLTSQSDTNNDNITPATIQAIKNPSNEITYDDHHHDRFTPGDPSKRAFTYFVLTGGRFLYAAAIRLAVLKFILSMTASKDVLALSSLEVDLSPVSIGQTITVKWRGKPVFIRRRSDKDINDANDITVSTLRHPETDAERIKNPEWLIVVGVCTHLGCVPIANAGDYNGWYCPCHGSHYDISGRIRRGPAPYNLEVPEYKFLDDDTVVIG